TGGRTLGWASSLGFGELALACPQSDPRPLWEVGDLDDALVDLGQSAVAAVGGQPVGAAHGRRGIAPPRPEAPLALGPELTDHLRRRGLGHAALLAFPAVAEVSLCMAKLDVRLLVVRCGEKHEVRGGAV